MPEFVLDGQDHPIQSLSALWIVRPMINGEEVFFLLKTWMKMIVLKWHLHKNPSVVASDVPGDFDQAFPTPEFLDPALQQVCSADL
jgi:hypothetical protein